MIAPGFERVGEVFASHARNQRTGGLAFAATIGGEPVVDLVAGEARPGEPWTSDTRSGTASIAKGWSVMCLHLMVERGRITLDTPVVDVWPEFGANGKDRILVRQLLDHTAGVIGLPDAASLLSWDGAGWDDLDGIAERLAASTPAWEPGTRCGYHAVTFGWLVGEIIRRVDGRTLGTVFREDIAQPLGIRSAIGVPIPEQGDLALVHGGSGALVEGKLLGRLMAKVPEHMRDPGTLLGRAFLADGTSSIMDSVDALMVDGRWNAAEVPSSNGVTSARDVARLYAVLANGGELDGIRLFSPETIELMYRPGEEHVDAVMTEWATGPIVGRLVRRMGTVRRSAGGFDGNRRGAAGPNPRTIGNGGAGGQMVLADPDAHLSAAFLRSEFSSSNTIQKALVEVLYTCIEQGAAR